MMDKNDALGNRDLIREALKEAINNHLITNSQSSELDTIGYLTKLIDLSHKDTK
jgi:hypothetical protein